MKKLIFLFAFCITVTNLFAQTDPNQIKKEGNDAFNAKNYPVAYAKFSEYLKQTNNQDSATAYYCGMAADEIKKYAEAVTYFDIAIQKKFNIGSTFKPSSNVATYSSVFFNASKAAALRAYAFPILNFF